MSSALSPLMASFRAASASSIARRSASPTLAPCSASDFSVEWISASAWFFASTCAFRFLSSSACASASFTIFSMSLSERPPEAWMRICCSLPVPLSRADRHDFIRIDALVRLLAEELLHDVLHLRHAGHAADEDDFVDLARRQAGILERLAAGLDRLLDEIVDQRLELGAGELQGEMLR